MADDKSDKAKATALKKQQQAEDGRKAMLDYEANAAAIRAKTERLRALRLARDAAQPPAPAKARKPAGKAGKAAKSGKSGAAAKTKAQPLAQWLDEQRKDGRHD